MTSSDRSDEMFNASTWLLDRHVDMGHGDRVAVRCGGQSHSYAGVLQLVERVAGALRSAGVQPEQRVAMAMLDSVEFVAVFLGAMRIGAVPLPMNPLLPGRDLGVIAADSRARLAVVSEARSTSLPDLLSHAPEITDVVITGDSEAGRGLSVPSRNWDGFVADGSDGSPYQTWAESPGFWLCTSGSTGRPKLAMHRHVDLKVTCDTYSEGVLQTTPDDRFFSVGPMFHAYGLGNSMTFPFAAGATAIIEPTRPPTPRLVADIMAAERPTLFFCIPTFYAALNAADLPDDTFASVRLGVSAAEPLPAETWEQFKARFDVTILDGIGSTEMLHIYLSNRPDELKPGSSGVAVPGYALKIVDDNGDEQPANEPGQLCVAGDSAATGYWCREATSRATFRGPWMHTGDLYNSDVDGFYTYMGRVDDMLRVGGEWVSPAEVEGVLIEHEAVLEAAVVGENDDQGVVRPVAYVILRDDRTADEDELDQFCRRRLAGFKRPKRYQFPTELPKTATGKIQRFKLRAPQ